MNITMKQRPGSASYYTFNQARKFAMTGLDQVWWMTLLLQRLRVLSHLDHCSTYGMMYSYRISAWFCFALLCWDCNDYQWIHVFYLAIFFRVASLTQGKRYYFSAAIEWQWWDHINIARHEQFGMFCVRLNLILMCSMLYLYHAMQIIWPNFGACPIGWLDS